MTAALTDTSTTPAPIPDSIDVNSSKRPARIGPVTADPYPWPYDGTVPATRLALLCIDYQTDFCGPGDMSSAWAMTSR